ncbi:MAG: Chemotaxis protein histidine kinase CheA [Candidatus Alkanophagales archaeon MCA70_species_2]|nr:Chemotaxis protein histidine kinase CheA [Candidatus Alkanophaga liquidiphilum]
MRILNDGGVDVTKYLQVFLDETGEHVQTLIHAVLSLESGDADAVHEAFRAAHTIKGMAASMGFRYMEQLCHALENVLDSIRNNRVDATSEVVDVLLESAATLEELLQNIETQGQEVTTDAEAETEISTLLSKLDACVSASADSMSADAEGAASVTKSCESDAVEEKTEKREGRNRTYEITVVLDKSCMFKGARGFLILKGLSEVGEIVKTTPPPQDIEEERFDFEFKVVLVTDADEADIKRVLNAIAEIECVKVRELQEEPQETKQARTEKSKKREEGIRSVRVGIEKLDTVVNLVGELVINKGRLVQIARKYGIKELGDTMSIVERTITDLQYEIMQMRMVSVEHIFNRFPKLVRDLCRKLSKEVEFIIEGKEIELDRTVLDEIVEPLIHLLRNAIDHGIEPPEERERKGKNRKGRVRLTAQRERGHVSITVEDDGRGIDVQKVKAKAVAKGLISEADAARLSNADASALIFTPGFSTADAATETSGRGVGMDVVKSKVEALGGTVEITSEKDCGTRITLRLPLTTAIIQALLISVGDELYAIPLSSVVEVVRWSDLNGNVRQLHGEQVMLLRGSLLPLLSLRCLLELPNGEEKPNAVVVVERSGEKLGLFVDSIIEQQEIVVKPLGKLLQGVKGLSGFTILGDGRVVPILDVLTLI